MTIRHLFPSDRVERAVGPRAGRRATYRWAQGYAQVTAHGHTVPPQTRREWNMAAERDGFTCKFHKSKQEARAALRSK